MIDQSALQLAELIRRREVSVSEVIDQHIRQIDAINGQLNTVVYRLDNEAREVAESLDRRLAEGEPCGPFFGVPFSVKDSIEVAGTPCTAGTLGRRSAAVSTEDATVVRRLRAAGAIPIAKTNLPDLLFSFETDNLLFGRTNNPYDQQRTPGGSSGGESALIAACGSPVGFGSDCLGSVRVPAAFCGIASIKPTSGRLPRTGHVPPAGGWIEKLWQIGPMARSVADLEAMMRVLCGADGLDLAAPPVPLLQHDEAKHLRVAYFADNGFAPASQAIANAVRSAADALARHGHHVEEKRPPCIEQSYELELALLGADGGSGVDEYLRDVGSTEVHPFLSAFVDRMRPFQTDAAGLAKRWSQWDDFNTAIARFFEHFDAVICPVYPTPALRHGESVSDSNFAGFSHTMAWSIAGLPAATVRVADEAGLPVNVQVVANAWRDMTALAICRQLESEFGGWKRPAI